MIRNVLIALLVLVLTIPARAGTTGGLSGTVVDSDTHAPIAGARVTATSPSQTSTGVTDAGGHFAFVSLAPDEYTISIEKTGYDPVSFAGAAVFADAQQTLSLAMR
ncbi:MAG: carboxypeptidase regulatory-like domain-containing protein, partial [Candidatus Eremiobacteraeota bacterium]|nr:carboxypeptidase regulatory-like domain-containing protein [Candidatus Eremiobacteraeota bacterium]